MFEQRYNNLLSTIISYPVLCQRIRFSIDLVLVRELTLYAVLSVYRNPRFLSNLLKIIKDGAREKEFICIKRLRSIDRKEKE